ncbi:proline-rich family protein [Dorcoceras hygrometricum]|uniref:Proline-rich family protein n=1 Tax=Dorcoceras hygrometricum TaxID=472368 RepID=A0A2Z7AF64_9LAMI|nr:proline-rich family protein [Dorcoceras hygrometricum]
MSDHVSCWYFSCCFLAGSSSNADVDFSRWCFSCDGQQRALRDSEATTFCEQEPAVGFASVFLSGCWFVDQQLDARASGNTALSSPCWDLLALMRRVVNYHSSWVGQRQVELLMHLGSQVTQLVVELTRLEVPQEVVRMSQLSQWSSGATTQPATTSMIALDPSGTTTQPTDHSASSTRVINQTSGSIWNLGFTAGRGFNPAGGAPGGGNLGFTAGRGFNPAGGAPGGAEAPLCPAWLPEEPVKANQDPSSPKQGKETRSNLSTKSTHKTANHKTCNIHIMICMRLSRKIGHLGQQLSCQISIEPKHHAQPISRWKSSIRDLQVHRPSQLSGLQARQLSRPPPR